MSRKKTKIKSIEKNKIMHLVLFIYNALASIMLSAVKSVIKKLDCNEFHRETVCKSKNKKWRGNVERRTMQLFTLPSK